MRFWQANIHSIEGLAQIGILSLFVLFTPSVSVAATSPIKGINVVYDG
jgi:hypothetical protein